MKKGLRWIRMTKCQWCKKTVPETKKFCSQRCKEKKRAYSQRPDVREKRRAYFQRPDVRERVRERMRAYSQRPDVRERMRAYSQRPDVRERVREKKRAYFQRPDVRERMRAYSQRPDVREKKRARLELQHIRKQYHALLSRCGDDEKQPLSTSEIRRLEALADVLGRDMDEWRNERQRKEYLEMMG